MAPGCSLAALQWLVHVQANDEKLLDKKGNRAILQHKYFRGEKLFAGWEIDGFAEVDNKLFFYEFLGCYFHSGCRNPECQNFSPDTTDERFQRKMNELSQYGEVIIMRECRWQTTLKKMKSKKTPSFPDINNVFSNEKKILEGIKNGSLFGYVVADVTTPPDVLQKILPLNFPPVIQRGEIDERMLSDYMRQRCESRQFKFPQKTLIQTYHGKQLLIYTPTVQFYMQIGLEISNISKFIQFLPTRPLNDFVEKITAGRIDAVKQKNDSLGTAYKIIGNS